jgi:peroxiredoxin
VKKTLKNRQEASAWQQKFDPLAPKVGDLAPDFELNDVRGEGRVRLSDFRGKKPVALIFGSFT